MKKALLFLLLAVALQPSFAQDSTKTLFKNKGLQNFGFFGRGGVQYSKIANRTALPFDCHMGISFNQRWRMGMAFEALMNNITVKNSALVAPYTRMRWQYSNFGGFLEYAFMPKRLISISPGLFAGYGTISKHPLDGPNLDVDGDVDDSNFFVFKPYLNINLNITRFVGVYVSGGYRFSTGEVTQGISDKQLSGAFGVVGLKFEIIPELLNNMD
jgi:hypothetical protein